MSLYKWFNNNFSEVGFAAGDGDAKLLRKLLSEKKNYDCLKSSCGWFPIYEASRKGHTDCVKELLKAVYDNGDDPVDIWQSEFPDLGVNQNPLVLAAQHGHCETVKVLLNIYPTNSLAFWKGIKASLLHPEILESLLSVYTGDINFRHYPDFPLLHIAVENSPIQSLMLLVKYGINLEARDGGGNTALHYAIKRTRRDQLDVIEYLVDNGCNVNACNMDGCSALFLATSNCLTAVALHLLSLGANPYLSVCCFTKNGYKRLASINMAIQKRLDVCLLYRFLRYTSFEKLMQMGIICPLVSAVIGNDVCASRALLGYDEYQHWLLNNYLVDEDLILSYYNYNILLDIEKNTFTYSHLKILLEHGACIKPLCNVQDFYFLVFNCSSFEVLKLFVEHGYLEFYFANKNFISAIQKTILGRFSYYNNKPEKLDYIRRNMIFILEFLPVIKCENVYNKGEKLTNITPVVPSLISQTRFKIRKSLLQASGHLKNIDQLPLPKLLQLYLISFSRFDKCH